MANESLVNFYREQIKNLVFYENINDDMDTIHVDRFKLVLSTLHEFDDAHELIDDILLVYAKSDDVDVKETILKTLPKISKTKPTSEIKDKLDDIISLLAVLAQASMGTPKEDGDKLMMDWKMALIGSKNP